MPGLTAADTIKILVATDNHVGVEERNAIRGEDSWKTFNEVMSIAKERDVDLVLLAGDLFHENKPSRKSMNSVIRSLREHCLGEKPCELEMLSDNSEVFGGAFNYVNYEDPDINVSIPVFSIHGNHDDPSGEGHLAALDILQTAGLVNYYGRTPEADNIEIKPVLLQKGRTKLALYGMSNVRDERLFRTFRDGKVRFFQPGQQKSDWFNLMSVHQNHHAYTETGYLPENFLPDFLDLVIWGHEHECIIDPQYNPETHFHVMQPGSSVATSLCPGEAVAKHVAILTIQGKEFKSESVRLQTVRPFIMREIVLQQEKEAMKLAKKPNNRPDITRFLESKIYEMIEEANQEWEESQGDRERYEGETAPLPLIRLRVEYTPPEGGTFDCENPQRFSLRFVGKVANTQDIVQFHRRRAGATRAVSKVNGASLPEEPASGSFTLDSAKVGKLVREMLDAQSLTMFPQNSFSDAVIQFVDKDDKHAMEVFVAESLDKQVEELAAADTNIYGDNLVKDAFKEGKSFLENLFEKQGVNGGRPLKIKPRPEEWDSDLDGRWADNPSALIHSDVENAEEQESEVASEEELVKSRSRTVADGKKAAPAKKAPTKTARGKKKVIEEDSDEDEDVIMVNRSDDSDSQLFIDPEPAPKRGAKKPAAAPKKTAPVKRAPARAAKNQPARQQKLDFSQSQTKSQTKGNTQISDDDISDDDDDDAFEPPPTARSTRARR